MYAETTVENDAQQVQIRLNSLTIPHVWSRYGFKLKARSKFKRISLNL